MHWISNFAPRRCATRRRWNPGPIRCNRGQGTWVGLLLGLLVALWSTCPRPAQADRKDYTIWPEDQSGLGGGTPFDPPYPRLANAYWTSYVDSNVVRALAHWDVVILHSFWSNEQLASLRALNPAVRLFPYVNPYSVVLPPASGDAWQLENFAYAQQNDLWWYDINSGVASDWPGTQMANITALAPQGPGGSWRDYMPMRIQSLLATHPALDGVFLDNFWQQLSWQQVHRHLDSDCNPTHNPSGCNGVADSNVRLDSLWNAALWSMAASTRQKLDELQLLHGRPLAIVTNNSADYFPYLNGTMHEFFPSGHSNIDYDNGYGYNWNEEMLGCPAGYLVSPFSSDPYRVSILNADYLGTPWTHPKTDEFERNKRFTLGSTLLGDGFYSLDSGLGGHGNLWWEPEYDHAGRGKGYLGHPRGPMRRILEPTGAEMLANGSFTSGAASWLGYGFGATGTLGTDAAIFHSAPAAGRIDVSSVSPDGAFKIWQAPIPLVQHQAYTLSFWVRASVSQQMKLHFYSESCPGARCWNDRRYCVSSEWTRFEMSFRSSGTAPAGFNLFFDTPGTVWIDDISLRTGDTGLFRRDFEHGIVLVNYTNSTQNVSLERTYYHLNVPGYVLYDAAGVASESVPSCDARILLDTRAPDLPHPPPSGAPEGTAPAPGLAQNVPNPFNPATRIRFGLARAQHVRLEVHDVAGRLLHTLVDERLEAGDHEVSWDGRNLHGQAVPSGVYFYVVRTQSGAQTRKMTLIR